MVKVEDIRMKRPFEDNTFIVIEGKNIEERPCLYAQLFLPPDRYEYLGIISMLGKDPTTEELEKFVEEIEKLARIAIEKHRLELFLGTKGYKRF